MRDCLLFRRLLLPESTVHINLFVMVLSVFDFTFLLIGRIFPVPLWWIKWKSDWMMMISFFLMCSCPNTCFHKTKLIVNNFKCHWFWRKNLPFASLVWIKWKSDWMTDCMMISFFFMCSCPYTCFHDDVGICPFTFCQMPSISQHELLHNRRGQSAAVYTAA